jgi:hypothetical protein
MQTFVDSEPVPRGFDKLPLPDEVKLYRVTLDTHTVGVMGTCLRDILFSVAELWPGQKIRGAIIAPEWDDE